MSNQLKFVKNVNNSGTVNNLQLLFQFILGSDRPDKHDDTQLYKKGDFVYKYVEAEGEYHVYMAIRDTRLYTAITNTEYWQKMSLKDLIAEGKIALGKSEDLIVLSDEEPTQINNDIWLKPLKYKSFGGVEKEDITLIFEGKDIAGQDDEPDDPNVRLWFDYEFDDEGNLVRLKSDDEEETIDGDVFEILLDDFSDF